jgi:hypothetical protein
MLTVIHAQELGTPRGRDKIDWKLITDLPLSSSEEAIEKLNWYSIGRKIATLRKIPKSGCKAEELRLSAAARLANLIAVFCILIWRIFWLTMMNRALPDAPPKLAFTALEIYLWDHQTKGKDPQRLRRTSVSAYFLQLARLGGYLARAGDSPPGNKVIWKGRSHLTDIQFGFLIGARLVGD